MNTRQPYTPFRKPAIAVSLAMLAVMLMGCNLPSTPAATATPSLPPISSLLPPLISTPVLPFTLTFTPSLIPSPTVTTTPAIRNIVFSAGATAAVDQTSIDPKQVLMYTINAGQNQPMILNVSSPHNDVTLGVTEPDGTVLLDPANKWTNWQWRLPITGVYTIRVYGGATNENYTLTTKVAKRVAFPTGSTTLTLSGSTPNGYVVSYALTCGANLTMTASINVATSSAYLDVIGLASGPLLSPAAKSNYWSGTLPATQDYIIEVIPNGGQVVNYTLTVSVN